MSWLVSELCGLRTITLMYRCTCALTRKPVRSTLACRHGGRACNDRDAKPVVHSTAASYAKLQQRFGSTQEVHLVTELFLGFLPSSNTDLANDGAVLAQQDAAHLGIPMGALMMTMARCTNREPSPGNAGGSEALAIALTGAAELAGH